ncbi:MAG: ABC transporter ATP-binding protein, partial [Carnobacterium maltaromaticum]
DIIEFSELGEFIYQPIKKYSSGMKSRLGFAISIQADPDVLVVDEALSVGDRAFADKCLKVIQGLTKTDKTVIFVSHSNQQIKQFCDHVIWLDRGKVVADSDNLDSVLGAYDTYVTEKKKNKDAIPTYVEDKLVALAESASETVAVKMSQVKTGHTVLASILIVLTLLLLFIAGFIIGFFIF